MKVNRLEAHDRLEFLIKDQSEAVQKGADDCLLRNPDSLWYQEKSPYIYIFGHSRTADDGVNKRLIWQPRLTRPTPEPNSYLFRVLSKTDQMETCWVLPPQEFWGQYKKGNIIQSNDVSWSIDQYLNHFADLAKPFDDDLPKHVADDLLYHRAKELEEEAQIRKAQFKPVPLVASSILRV